MDSYDRKGIYMWLAIFAFSIILAVAAIIYLGGKLRMTGIFSGIKNGILVKILPPLTVIAIAFLLCLILDVNNTVVLVVYLAAFMLISDLVAFIVSKSFGAQADPRYFSAAAFILFVIYMCYGWHLMHGLWETDYSLSTDKSVSSLKVAQIADSHIGCGFDGDGFAQRLSVIQKTGPDMLVITGDFVDDSTTKADMITACAALGNFETRYGIYFCFGNHDAGYFSNERRGYGKDDLKAELEKNGVTVLEDESVAVGDGYYVIGRADAGYGRADRLAIDELVADLDKDKYMIVLDHQPTDYEAEEAAGVDLVLSGHTHGGQLWPLEYIQPLLSENDNVRGLEKRGNTDFIVTDGISDWAIKFRTGCRSEFNIISIQ